VTPVSDSVEEKSFVKRKDNSWKQTQSSSLQAPQDDLDDETESVLKMLEKSAPGEEGEEAVDSAPVKGRKKNADSDAVRTTPTKRAEDSTAQAMYLKGVSFFQHKKYKEAKIAFVKAYKMNPKGPNAADSLLKLGEVLAQDNKNDACTAWRKLETDFPHMSSEMKSDLTTLKKTYGCVKKTENAKKPVPNR
jgi:tetratricopeptide (TPR) repeat protein